MKKTVRVFRPAAAANFCPRLAVLALLLRRGICKVKLVKVFGRVFCGAIQEVAAQVRKPGLLLCKCIVASLLPLASAAVYAGQSPTEPDIRRDATVIAVEKVMPSVVNIATETIVEYQDFYQNIFREFFGQSPFAPRRQREQSIGSGVLIDEEGYVLTNLHVVRRANRT